jgi:anti-sigma regulatory factor (Ser/Thr protein kinase)
VREVRRWVEDLLPDCDPLADLLLLTSELCANAVVHTRSGDEGGWFSVDIEWAPASARVVVTDQGSPKLPAIGTPAGGTPQADESGRGLQLVNELADDWGTASRPLRRWVWADVRWRARGGPLLKAPGGVDAAIRGAAAVREAFPGTTAWWGHLARAWWAALPGATDASGLTCSPTRDGLGRALARAYPAYVHAPVAGGPPSLAALSAEEWSKQP